MPNPFDELITNIETKLRSGGTQDKLLGTVVVQIKLLAVLFRSMHEYDMREHMQCTNSEDIKNHNYKTTKAVLDYFQFITVLNQLGRILVEKKILIPEFYRIRFFRNKVFEHWEDYANYGVTGSGSQTFGEAIIPSTVFVYLPEERKEIKNKIDILLFKYGLTLVIDNPGVGNIADISKEEIYSVLENIDQKLENIPKPLIKLLFKFGFPAPISNIRTYSDELIEFLKTSLAAKLTS